MASLIRENLVLSTAASRVEATQLVSNGNAQLGQAASAFPFLGRFPAEYRSADPNPEVQVGLQGQPRQRAGRSDVVAGEPSRKRGFVMRTKPAIVKRWPSAATLPGVMHSRCVARCSAAM